MDRATNMETQLAEQTLQEPALAQSGSNVLRRHIKENPKKAVLARHRLWMSSIPHEYPMPYTPYKIGVYIRYFNQTRHENYLEKHIQQYMDDIALCPQWTLVDFYVDKGMTAPHMEYSKEWCRLLAAQEHPVGIYFISEDIFTLASYYQTDLRDMGLLPDGWQTLPADELDEPMLSTLPKPAMLEQAEQLSLVEETDAME